MINEIKKILDKNTASRFWSDREAWIEVTTQEILALFPKGDEKGLLADEEILNLAAVSRLYIGKSEAQGFLACVKSILKAQQALTTGLKDAEKEEAVKVVKQEILSIMKSAPDLRTLEKNIADWLGNP